MKRVSWFFPSFGSGGVQRAILRLSQAFLQHQLSVDLVVVDAHGPFLKHIPAGARVIDLHASGSLAAIPRLVAYLQSARPDVLISAQNHVNLVAVLARRMARTKTRLILTEHNDMLEGARRSRTLRDRLRPAAARLLYPLSDEIVAVSKGVAESMSLVAHLPARKIHVIYNAPIPQDLSELAMRPPGHAWLETKALPVILAVGRLVPQKDSRTLLRAFACLNGRHAARLIILGEGPERRKLENLAMSLGISDWCSMPGFAENPYAYMSRADVFVLSSAYEGFPSVLVEALACGARIVSTNCRSGPSEILDEGRYGRLVPVGDVAALAEAIESTLADKGFRPEAAMARAALFSVEKTVEAYMNILFDTGPA